MIYYRLLKTKRVKNKILFALPAMKDWNRYLESTCRRNIYKQNMREILWSESGCKKNCLHFCFNSRVLIVCSSHPRYLLPPLRLKQTQSIHLFLSCYDFFSLNRSAFTSDWYYCSHCTWKSFIYKIL